MCVFMMCMCVGSHGTVHVWNRGQLWSWFSPSSYTWGLGLSSGLQACVASALPLGISVSEAVTVVIYRADGEPELACAAVLCGDHA